MALRSNLFSNGSRQLKKRWSNTENVGTYFCIKICGVIKYPQGGGGLRAFKVVEPAFISKVGTYLTVNVLLPIVTSVTTMLSAARRRLVTSLKTTFSAA